MNQTALRPGNLRIFLKKLCQKQVLGNKPEKGQYPWATKKGSPLQSKPEGSSYPNSEKVIMWRMPTEIQEIDTDNLRPYEGEEAQVILLCNPIG